MPPGIGFGKGRKGPRAKAVALGQLVLDDGDPDDNVAMATDRVVDAINARVIARSKEI